MTLRRNPRKRVQGSGKRRQGSEEPGSRIPFAALSPRPATLGPDVQQLGKPVPIKTDYDLIVRQRRRGREYIQLLKDFKRLCVASDISFLKFVFVFSGRAFSRPQNIHTG